MRPEAVSKAQKAYYGGWKSQLFFKIFFKSSYKEIQKEVKGFRAQSEGTSGSSTCGHGWISAAVTELWAMLVSRLWAAMLSMSCSQLVHGGVALIHAVHALIIRKTGAL